jgi:hypothetical protein
MKYNKEHAREHRRGIRKKVLCTVMHCRRLIPIDSKICPHCGGVQNPMDAQNILKIAQKLDSAVLCDVKEKN